MLSAGILFVPTFIGHALSDADVNDPDKICNGQLRGTGTARLYALRIADGSRWSGFNYGSTHKYLEIENAKITGLSPSGRGSTPRGVATIDKLGAVTHDASLKTLVDNPTDAMLSFNLPTAPGGSVNMEPAQNFINYWIMR